jgi:hypothetical protein
MPWFATCVNSAGDEIELVVKFSAGCEMRHRSLMNEALAALLAVDLDLPVPEPFLVRVEADLAATILEDEHRKRAMASVGWNFGSKKLPPGFATFPVEKPLPRDLLATAAEILAFDVFVANPDRRERNPNVLFNGRELAIYDHELAFFFEGTISWKSPWEPGSIRLKNMPLGESHVFLRELTGKPHDFTRLSGAFEAISAERLSEYRDAIPEEWIGDGKTIQQILDYIGQLRDNVGAAIVQLKGALM